MENSSWTANFFAIFFCCNPAPVANRMTGSMFRRSRQANTPGAGRALTLKAG